MPENTENMPFLSIVTVTRNNLSSLQRTFILIQQQSCQDYEWIVIDGASDDQTTDFLEKTTANWVSEPDSGIYHAMNKGIARAKGKYILFLNAGDTFANNTVIASIKENAAGEPDFIYGDAHEHYAYKPARSLKIEYGMFTHHQSMLYRRDKIGELRYNEKYKIAADYDFTARFLKDNPTATHIPIPICDFETGGISQQSASLGRAEQHEIRKELKLCGDFKNALITTAQTCRWTLRTIAPSLYWRLKSCGNTRRASAQT